MATRHHDQIVETPDRSTPSRARPVRACLLTVSTGLAVLILASSGSCSSVPDRRGNVDAAARLRRTASRLMAGTDWNRTLPVPRRKRRSR